MLALAGPAIWAVWVLDLTPWARHGAGHTWFFGDQVAWLAAACSKTTVTQLMRLSWRTAVPR